MLSVLPSSPLMTREENLSSQLPSRKAVHHISVLLGAVFLSSGIFYLVAFNKKEILFSSCCLILYFFFVGI